MERRNALRFESLFTVLVDSDHFGTVRCVARNVSSGGIFVESRDPIPLGTELCVWFVSPQGQPSLGARGTVRNHYFINYTCDTANLERTRRRVVGMGIRFIRFIHWSDSSIAAAHNDVAVLH